MDWIDGDFPSAGLVWPLPLLFLHHHRCDVDHLFRIDYTPRVPTSGAGGIHSRVEIIRAVRLYGKL